MGHRETVDSLCSIICKMAYIIEQQDQIISMHGIPVSNKHLEDARKTLMDDMEETEMGRSIQ